MRRFLHSRHARYGLAAAIAGYTFLNPVLRRRLLSARSWRRALYLGALLVVLRPPEHTHDAT